MRPVLLKKRRDTGRLESTPAAGVNRAAGVLLDIDF
jgi:hypothetical protein